jgi:HK97 gp10 family phage protein
MAKEDDEFERAIGQLSFKLRRQIAEAIKAEADRLADAIKAAAPVKTGKLRDSVKVRRTRNELTLYVTAGGEETTRMYGRDTDYASDVVIDGRSNKGIAKRRKGEGRGVSFDYALATEYGTSKENAQPFFYPTARELEPSIRENIEQAVSEALE